MLNAPSKFNVFSVALGIADGKKAVVLGSTAEPPTGHHATFLDAADARIMADHLKALADHLDPPKKEWSVLGADGKITAAFNVPKSSAELSEATAAILQRARKRRPAKKARKAKRK